MRWFRMYAETVNNPKLKLLAFEDRWHYVAVLCMKSKGILDRTDELRDRLIAAELGLTRSEADEVRRRLMEVDLVLADWQPKGWGKYQYESDNAAARMRKHREKKQQPTSVKRNRDVTVTNTVTIDTDTDTDTDTEKKKTRASARAFRPPSRDDVITYTRERNSTVDPDGFIDYYDSVGWRVGNKPMKDWKAAIRTWEKRDEEDRRSGKGHGRESTRQFAERMARIAQGEPG